MKSFSFFEVDEKFSKPLIGALNGKDFNGTVVKVENSRPAPSRSRDRARKDGFKEYLKENYQNSYEDVERLEREFQEKEKEIVESIPKRDIIKGIAKPKE